MQTKQRLIEIVTQVPTGKAVSYGQLGRILGVSGLIVGRILSSMPEEEWPLLPWWRVVAKDGYVASLKLGPKGIRQLDLLTQEGFDVQNERVDMIKHGYDIEAAVNKDSLL